MLTLQMSALIKEIETDLADKNIGLEKVEECEKKLADEYNTITEKYRILFDKLACIRQRKAQEIIDSCSHNYTRYSEYHNERYFICNKCGHEKY